MFSTIRKKSLFILLGVLFMPLVFLFQNCGKKTFSVRTDATQASVEDVTDIPDEQPPTESEPVPPGTPLKSTTVKIDRDIKEERPTHLLLVLDDSTSNAVNIPKMLDGVKDIISKFSGKQYKISVYTTGNSPLDKTDYSIGKYVTTKKTENPDANTTKQINTKTFVSNAALAEFDSALSNDANAFFGKVETYFKKVQASTKIMADSTPDYHCSLLSYFKELSKKEDVEGSKYIVLVSSDENTKYLSDVCVEKEVVTQVKRFNGSYKTIAATAQRLYVEVPMEKRTVMEGGIEVWSKISQKFYDVTCSGAAQSQATTHISKNPAFRFTSQGYSCVDKIQAAAPAKQEKIYDLVSDDKETVPMFIGNNYLQQVAEMQKSFNKGLLFYGTFTIRDAAEKVNTDQEIGLDHDKYANLYALSTNVGKYGVTQSNYDDFVDEVFVFDLITSNNFFSLVDHKLEKALVQSIRLTKYNGVSMNKSLPFTQTNTSITVTDATINLDEGCELEITYAERAD